MPSASPKLLNFNQQHSNLYKIEVMITSLIEMLELPNFGHMITPTKQFEPRGKIPLVTS